MEETPMLDAALSYARAGLAVVPLLERDKVPAVKGGVKAATKSESVIMDGWKRRPNMNVGIACGEVSNNLVVIDIDNHGDSDGLETLRKWEIKHGALKETATSVTGTGGMHLLYFTDGGIRNSTNSDAGIDIRGDGGYIVAPPSIHPNGNTYELENYLYDVPIAKADANVYAFIESVQGRKAGENPEKFDMPETVGAGERNDTLFKLACSYQSQGFDDEVIAAAVEAANKRKCEPPLPVDEVRRIVQSALEYDKGHSIEFEIEKTQEKEKPKSKGFNVFARELIEVDHACYIDGAPAIWDGAKYATGWDAIHRQIIERKDDCKESQRKEICKYLEYRMPVVEPSPPELIAFSNGVLDLADWKIKPYSPEMVITNIIPHECDMESYDATVDRFLDDIANQNIEIRQNLEEIIGMCLYRSNEFGTCPILIGSGANGKSTFIKALRNVLGGENVSALDIQSIGKRFMNSHLVGKLANLGDDIPNTYLKGELLGDFKKVVTGDDIFTDIKGGTGFTFKPYCTLLFSCNEMPALGDVTDGMMRRLHPIPFNAKFTRESANYDPRIADKLTTENAARYLINLGAMALQRMIGQKGMTPNEASRELVKDVEVENNNILQWMEDEGLTIDSLIGKPIPECFEAYQKWGQESNVRNLSKRATFTRRITSRFGVRSEPRKFDVGDRKKTMKTFVI